MTIRPRITARAKARHLAGATRRAAGFTAMVLVHLAQTVVPAYLGAVRHILTTNYTDPDRRAS